MIQQNFSMMTDVGFKFKRLFNKTANLATCLYKVANGDFTVLHYIDICSSDRLESVLGAAFLQIRE